MVRKRGSRNVVAGGADVGEELCTHRGVDMIGFTGSTATGRRIRELSAATMKRAQLELGGKSAHIVLDDVTENDVAGIGFGQVLMHAGQACTVTSRLLLPEHLFKERTRREWTDFFIATDIAGAPAFLGADLFDDDHTKARRLVYEQAESDGTSQRLIGTCVKTKPDERFAPPAAPHAGAAYGRVTRRPGRLRRGRNRAPPFDWRNLNSGPLKVQI